MFSNSQEYSYIAYGLNIGSTIKIPDLVDGNLESDVKVRFGDLTDQFLDCTIKTPVIETPGCRVRVSEHAMSFDWPKIGKFLIVNGDEVVVEPASEAIEDDLVPFLTGPVMIALLHQRGYLVLHGSSVMINGATVAFLGQKGHGKSTLAATMSVRGHSLLSDDVVPIYFSDGKPHTIPGYPRIKLNPDSVNAIGSDPDSLPLIHRLIEKHSFTTPQFRSGEPVELSAVYFLDLSDKIEIQSIKQTQGFVELVANTHANHHLKRLNSQEKHFGICQQLVLSVPVFRLARPHRFDLIEDVCLAVENHIYNLRPAVSEPTRQGP